MHTPDLDVRRIRVSGNPTQLVSPPDQLQLLTKVPKTDDTGVLSGWIEALGVDSSYRPPMPEPRTRPVACFYIKLLHREREGDQTEQEGRKEYHRAVYLWERSVNGFLNAVAQKWGLEREKIVRLIRVVAGRGLEVGVDDDVTRELAEGQDMALEIVRVCGDGAPKQPVKRVREMSLDDDAPADADPAPDLATQPEGYELRLVF